MTMPAVKNLEVEPTFDNVFTGLILGFDGVALPAGPLNVTDQFIDESDFSESNLPLLSLQEGAMTLNPWDEWSVQAVWSLPAILEIPVNYADYGGQQIRASIQALIARAVQLRGLPVNDRGEIVPFYPTREYDYAAGALAVLTRTGPNIGSVRVVRRPERRTAQVSMTITIDAIINVDPRTPHRVKVIAVSVVPVMPNRAGLPDDWTGAAVPTASDVSAIGQFDTPDPLADTARGSFVRTSPPLPVGGTRSVAGDNSDPE